MLRQQHVFHRKETADLIAIMFRADQSRKLHQKSRIELKLVARKIQMEKVRGSATQRAENGHAEPLLAAMIVCQFRQCEQRTRIFAVSESKLKLVEYARFRIFLQR